MSSNYVPRSISDHLPAMVRNEVSSLSPERQEEFVEEFRRKAKSGGICFLLWIFGLHYIYIGKWGVFLVFLLTAGGLFIWWFIDLFRIIGLVRDHNKDVAVDVLRNMKTIRN